MIMGRTTRNSQKLSKASRSVVRASRKGALDNICMKMYKEMTKNNNRLPYGYMTKLLGELGSTSNFNWLTPSIINKAFLKYKKSKIEEEKKKQEHTGSESPKGLIVRYILVPVLFLDYLMLIRV